MEPIRILHVVTYMGRGGLETMLMNYYRNMDRTKIQFDFLVHRDFEADYDLEILSLGGKIYHVPRLNPFDRNYIKTIDNFFNIHNEYKIVHSHLDCMSGIPLKYAKKNGIPIRIAHAHTKSQDKNLKYPIKLVAKQMIPQYATKLFACGNEAGSWMFHGRKFNILNNAIDAEKYQYNEKIRTKCREQLKLHNQLVVGHVGRFSPPKNHDFLIEIFYELLKKKPNSKLLLIGDGEGRKLIEKKAIRLGIKNQVLFLGVRSDVSQLMQAIDVFVFPSLYEGLPVTLIEAQAAGLPCLISNQVPLECKMTDLVHVKKLSDDASIWADKILDLSKKERKNTMSYIKECGYDIHVNAQRLQSYYLRVSRETK